MTINVTVRLSQAGLPSEFDVTAELQIDVLPDGLLLDPVTGHITGILTTATDGFLGLTIARGESLLHQLPT